MKTVIEMAQAVGYPMLVFMGQPYVSPELKRLVDAAVAQEREACAKAGKDALRYHPDLGSVVESAIRARSQA